MPSKALKPLFYAPFLAVGWAHAARRLAELKERLIGLEFFASRFLINKTLRRSDGRFIYAESVAADPLPAIVSGLSLSLISNET